MTKIILIISIIMIVFLFGCQGPATDKQTCGGEKVFVGPDCCFDNNNDNICDEEMQSGKIYWFQSTRSCSTIPDKGPGNKVNFCEVFCGGSYKLWYSKYSCARADVPSDFLQCACIIDNKNPTGYTEWLTTYRCADFDIEKQCDDHCLKVGMKKETFICENERIKCGCGFIDENVGAEGGSSPF